MIQYNFLSLFFLYSVSRIMDTCWKLLFASKRTWISFKMFSSCTTNKSWLYLCEYSIFFKKNFFIYLSIDLLT